MSRIKDKKQQIYEFLEQVTPEIPENLEEYESDYKAVAICERYFEKIIESIFDLAFIFIKENKMELPEGDDFVMAALAKEKVIPVRLAERLDDARRMRNIIAHLYGEIDNEKVFYSIKNELLKNVEAFLEVIK